MHWPRYVSSSLVEIARFGHVAFWTLDLPRISVLFSAVPMPGRQPYRMIIRHSISGLAPDATFQLRFDQIGDVFPPGVAGGDIHPDALSDLKAFADDAGCDVVKDNEAKVFLFRKRKDSPTAKY